VFILEIDLASSRFSRYYSKYVTTRRGHYTNQLHRIFFLCDKGHQFPFWIALSCDKSCDRSSAPPLAVFFLAPSLLRSPASAPVPFSFLCLPSRSTPFGPVVSHSRPRRSPCHLDAVPHHYCRRSPPSWQQQILQFAKILIPTLRGNVATTDTNPLLDATVWQHPQPLPLVSPPPLLLSPRAAHPIHVLTSSKLSGRKKAS
jgi:hypothetical protein